jgi:hypothetical protein
LTRRVQDDGAPHVPGEAEDTLPGALGPIALRDMVAYRVIEPAANGAAYRVEITIPTATTRRVRFVDPDGRPVHGATVVGLTPWPSHRVTLDDDLTPWPSHRVTLDDDEAEVFGLDPTRERAISALSPDGRLSVETTIRGDSTEPVTVRMKRPAS